MLIRLPARSLLRASFLHGSSRRARCQVVLHRLGIGQAGSWISRRSPHPPPPRQPQGHLQRARQEVHEWWVQAGSPVLAQFPQGGNGLPDVPEEALSTRSWSWGAPWTISRGGEGLSPGHTHRWTESGCPCPSSSSSPWAWPSQTGVWSWVLVPSSGPRPSGVSGRQSSGGGKDPCPCVS